MVYIMQNTMVLTTEEGMAAGWKMKKGKGKTQKLHKKNGINCLKIAS